MRITLRGENGPVYQLDTPDPSMVGTWLKVLFDSFTADGMGKSSSEWPYHFDLDVRG